MTAALQEALCALVTDGGLRRRWHLDGSAALDGFALEADEMAALAAIAPEALDRYAGSLLAKRTEEFARAVPLSCRVAPSLPGRYRALLGSHPSPLDDSVLGPGHQEALRLLAPLRRALESDEGEAPWAGDLLVVEVLRGASRSDGEVRTAALRHQLRPVLADLAGGRIPIDVEEAALEVRSDRAGLRWRAR